MMGHILFGAKSKRPFSVEAEFQVKGVTRLKSISGGVDVRRNCR
jgi:hypothetical protein